MLEMIFEFAKNIVTPFVVVTITSLIINSGLKKKDLKLRLKLEEKNIWISNIDSGFKEYIDSVVSYSKDLMDYSLFKKTDEEISFKLVSCNKSHNNLVFYLYQTEYNRSLVEEIIEIMDYITLATNEQREKVIDYRSKVQNVKCIYNYKVDLSNNMKTAEDKIGSKNYEMAEKIGELVRLEKVEITNEIIGSNWKFWK